MEKLVHIPAVTKLTPLVSRFLGMNPGKFSLQGTNTYLIGQGPRRLLIDTGEGADEYTETVSNYLKENNIELDTIILSHWHADHTKGTVPLLKKLKDKNVQSAPPKVVKYPFPEMDKEKKINEGWSIDEFLDDGQVISNLGFHMSCHLFPGHASDHLCFWLEEDDVLFSADNILGQGTSVFEDLTAYMKSLEGMRRTGKERTKRADGQFQIFPGHGPVIENGWEKITEYISQRKKRETQVFTILQEKGPSDARTITRQIYEGYPERILDAAQHTTTMQLMKLEDDGVVVSDNRTGMWKLKEKASI